MDSMPSPEKVGGLIPHFYYDVIGRILPGAFFILGLITTLGSAEVLDSLNRLKTWLGIEKATELPWLILASVSLLFFGVLAYFVGLLLGNVSYFAFEKDAKLRPRFWGFSSLSASDLFGVFGSAEGPKQDGLKQRFKSCFKIDIAEDDANAFREQSRMCAYYVWSRSSNLGQMSSRWDAEALGSRSICFSGAMLFLTRAYQQFIQYVGGGRFYWRLAIIFLVISLIAGSQYEFLRRRQLLGRFVLFYSVAPGPN